MIPEKLRSLKRFCNWVKKPPHGKIPLQHCDKPETWLTYEEALAQCSREPFVGLGIQLGPPIVGIDLDWKDQTDAVPFETLPEYARAIIDQQDSYTEWSPSGKGCHILCSGRLEKAIKTPGVEVYGEDRFFTVTGRVIRDAAVNVYKPITSSNVHALVPKGMKNNDLATEAGRILKRGEVTSAEELIERLQVYAKHHHVEGDPEDPKLLSIGQRFWDKYQKDGATVDTDSIKVFSHRDLVALEAPERIPFAVTGDGTQILTAYSLNQIFAFRGTGKTLLQMAWAMAMASGRDFICYQHPMPRRVLYIEGELPTTLVQHRIKSLARYDDLSNLFWLIRDHMPLGFYLDIKECRDFITRYVVDNKIEVLFFDSSQSLLMRPENEEETWLEIAPWLVQLRSLGCCVVFTRQTGKDQSRGARGHSRAEDLLDVAIQLTQIDAGTGHFNAKLEYTKFRGTGDIRPFTIEKPITGLWSYHKTDDDLDEEIREMAADGKGQREIAKELGIRRERVSRVLKEKTREPVGLY